MDWLGRGGRAPNSSMPSWPPGGGSRVGLADREGTLQYKLT
eukprot:COSAG01_NODE_72214_length_253_cov_1.331169_1_plen_40_part_01